MPKLKPLIDGDIFLYEVGFGAETGWREMKENPEDVPMDDPSRIPPWSYVEEMLLSKIANIKAIIDTNQDPIIFVTDGDSFRTALATVKPYKGNRKEHKPWHYANLKAYMKGLGAVVAKGVEADDLLSITHQEFPDRTIICSRDKDLRQVPGWFYSWELGAQPSFGPIKIENPGTLNLGDKNKLTGTGLLFFYSQMLTGDPVDNIPGLPKCGPVAAHKLLTDPDDARPLLDRVRGAYGEFYCEQEAEERMIEQGQLCWIVRRLKADGKPEIWYPGLES